MPEQDLDVDVNDLSVSVRLNVSGHAPRARFHACILFTAIGAIAISGLLFLPGKHGNPSMWHDLSSSPVDSGGFIVPLTLLLSLPVSMVLLTWRYVVFVYPSDETFIATD
jgi:hypothetical protein